MDILGGRVREDNVCVKFDVFVGWVWFVIFCFRCIFCG